MAPSLGCVKRPVVMEANGWEHPALLLLLLL